MRTSDFDFELPAELVAQVPTPERGQSRLLVLHRTSGQIEHRRFADLATYLNPGDVMVLNNSRVIPARLRAINPATDGRLEILLLEENAKNDWWAMVRPGKRARVGTRLLVRHDLAASLRFEVVVTDINTEGHRRLMFPGAENILAALEALGEVPLPPYIVRENGTTDSDRQRYQTVYAEPPGSVAAPTAGLHFTGEILAGLRAKGVELCFVTLHVGVGTFAPVKSRSLSGHRMHEERFEINESAAAMVRAARERGNQVLAVGTTALRVLESVGAKHNGALMAEAGRTSLFVYPPYDFKVADALVTNFHLPRSTLLMLVSAFAGPNRTTGRELVLQAYAEAIRERYRFFSYGDAMLLK
jgi:S-adenosylmethionine:tRNA ribosyltransferase-isomerase